MDILGYLANQIFDNARNANLLFGTNPREKGNKMPPYTQEEDFIILRNYPSTMAKNIVPLLKDRSKQSIHYRASRMGLSKCRGFHGSHSEETKKKISESRKGKNLGNKYALGNKSHTNKRKPIEERFENLFIPEPISGCWLWIGPISNSGHGLFGIKGFDLKWRQTGAHRVAWEIFNGPIPDGQWVLHKCDVRCCVNPSHLFLGNRRDNMDDCVKKQRNNKGEKQHLAKLTENDIRKIRDDKGIPNAKILASYYGVCKVTINDIKRGRTWKHIGR